MNLHNKGCFDYHAIRSYKTNFRLLLLELYKITQGKNIKDSCFTEAEPTSTFFALLFSRVTRNSGKRELVITRDPESKANIITVCFLDDCYNIETVDYVMSLFKNLYNTLHVTDTKAHNINHTLTVNPKLVEQILVLQAKWIKELAEGVEKLSEEKRIKLHYVNAQNKHVDVTSHITKNKSKVVASIFSFFSIIFIIEKVGLFPVIHNKLWKYKDTTQEAPMKCTIINFLTFVFDQSNFKTKTFYDTFSGKLSEFLMAYHTAENEKPDIFLFMNTDEYKKDIHDWVTDYAISNFFDAFYESVIVPSQKEFGQVEVHTMVGRKASQVVTKYSSKVTSSSSRSTKKRKRNSSSDRSEKKSKSSEGQGEDVMEFRSILSNEPGQYTRSSRRSNVSSMLCEECQTVSKGANSVTPLYCSVKVTTKDGVSGTVTTSYHCLNHARIHYVNARAQGKYKIVYDVDDESETGIAFSPLLKLVPFELIERTKMTDDIKKTIACVTSPSKQCDENANMYYECPLDCEGGENCNNKIVSKLRNMNLGTTNEIKGRVHRKETNNETKDGLFTSKLFRSEEPIIEYLGQAFLYDEKEGFPDSHYIIQLEKNCYLDAKHFGNLSRYINHSCEPNAKIQKIEVSFVSLHCLCV